MSQETQRQVIAFDSIKQTVQPCRGQGDYTFYTRIQSVHRIANSNGSIHLRHKISGTYDWMSEPQGHQIDHRLQVKMVCEHDRLKASDVPSPEGVAFQVSAQSHPDLASAISESVVRSSPVPEKYLVIFLIWEFPLGKEFVPSSSEDRKKSRMEKDKENRLSVLAVLRHFSTLLEMDYSAVEAAALEAMKESSTDLVHKYG